MFQLSNLHERLDHLPVPPPPLTFIDIERNMITMANKVAMIEMTMLNISTKLDLLLTPHFFCGTGPSHLWNHPFYDWAAPTANYVSEEFGKSTCELVLAELVTEERGISEDSF